jgi:predicted small lipoprotein YifL
MPRLSRLLLCMVLLAALGACGNKGDLVKPAAPADTAKSSPAQG